MHQMGQNGNTIPTQRSNGFGKVGKGLGVMESRKEKQIGGEESWQAFYVMMNPVEPGLKSSPTVHKPLWWFAQLLHLCW